MPQSVPIDPDKWLAHAHELAEHQQGAGRPKSTLLRRAVSTAYYGLFHALNIAVASDLLPDGTSEQRRELVRTFGHQELKACCAWIAGRQTTAPQSVKLLVDQLRTSPLAAISDAFCDLQEARHRADYDHAAAISKPTAVAFVEDADRAMRDLANVAPNDRQAFAVLVAMRSRQTR